MQLGFIPDYYHEYGVTPAKWVEGEPEKSFWTGAKVPKGKAHKVVTYRCTQCGYLESYATEETVAGRATN